MNTSQRIMVAFVFLILPCALTWCQSETPGQRHSTKLRLMTFNIRNGKAKDGVNNWENRKEFVCEVIRGISPDVLGVQEAYAFQLQYLGKQFSAYSVVGEGRDGGQKGEFSAIMYRKDAFTIKESGTFWLSDTPGKKSRSWGNRYLRICTWARFIDNHGQHQFYVYNTHFDHQSQNSRVKSAELVSNRILNRKHPAPFILMGDFNAGEDNEVIAYLKGVLGAEKKTKSSFRVKDTFRMLNPDTKNVGTGNGFQGRVSGPKIDYIFVPDGIKTTAASIIRKNRSGKYPSDHYPVFAEIELPLLKDNRGIKD